MFDSDLDSETESEEESDKENSIIPRPEALGISEDGFRSTDSEGESDMIESEIDIQTTFSLLKTGFNIFDEFDYFKRVISSLYKSHGPQMEELISKLSESTQKSLRGLILMKKVEIGTNVVHRRMFKVVRAANKD